MKHILIFFLVFYGTIAFAKTNSFQNILTQEIKNELNKYQAIAGKIRTWEELSTEIEMLPDSQEKKLLLEQLKNQRGKLSFKSDLVFSSSGFDYKGIAVDLVHRTVQFQGRSKKFEGLSLKELSAFLEPMTKSTTSNFSIFPVAHAQSSWDPRFYAIRAAFMAFFYWTGLSKYSCPEQIKSFMTVSNDTLATCESDRQNGQMSQESRDFFGRGFADTLAEFFTIGMPCSTQIKAVFSCLNQVQTHSMCRVLIELDECGEQLNNIASVSNGSRGNTKETPNSRQTTPRQSRASEQ